MHYRAAPRLLHLLLLAAIVLSALPPVLVPAAALADHTPDPTFVTIAGNLQSELGCGGDWAPACALTDLVYDANDDVWQQTFNLPANNAGEHYEYKAALNHDWAESYGLHGGSGNIPLALAADTSVKFYYDHKSHWITDNQNSTIATAAGNFQSELGCSGDWAPDCLRSWLQDMDGDGVYTFSTAALPPGNYEFKAALNEGWDVSYGEGGGGSNILFTVTNVGDRVTFSWDSATTIPTVDVDSLPPVDLASIAQAPPRNPIEDNVFYFVMPDRFENGDPSNDEGGLVGDRLVTGFDPTDKGFYHGGDLAGLHEKLPYLDDMGVTAIWMTPVFKNKPVQGSGADVSAGYHGYWTLDYTKFDPHFGTNAELQALITDAHARGIKIFFDTIVNHTADVIQYAEGVYDYRSKAEFPFRDADGLPFDDLDYAGGDTFPPLDRDVSFPYTPVIPEAETNAKFPAWLNDPIYYHNRGNSTFAGENSLYGDFFGLDDLFTSQPAVVQGMINIHKFWIDNFDIDGFRIDTVKHVNQEFWREFTPAVMQAAWDSGRSEFFVFGEVFSSNPELLSFYTTDPDMPAVLDFRFQEAVRSYMSGGGSAQGMQTLFAEDDWFTDEDSNVYSLPTFIGNHDRGRFGYFLNADNPGGLSDAEMLSRSKLAHAMMYFARGVPVTYYGDEQGFTGDGGDKDARQNMFPSQVASYNDDNLIGTDRTTADDNFEDVPGSGPNHPLYQAFSQYAALLAAHPALQSGAQIHRYADGGPGVYSFSRIDRSEMVEYVVAFNNITTTATVNVQTFYDAGAQFDLLLAEGSGAGASLLTGANGALDLTVPPLGFVVYKANAPVAAGAAAPEVSIANLTGGQVVQLGYQNLDGNEIPLRMEVAANVAGDQFTEVTFAVRATGTETFTVIGVDDNAPYRVFYDASQWPEGTQLDFLAVVNNLNGQYSGAYVSAVSADFTEEPQLADYDYAVVHYQRPGNDYGDHTTGDFNDFWGLHLWGSGIMTPTANWAQPLPFLGEDSFGRFAWINLTDPTQDINFIVHRGETKDPGEGDRLFNPAADGPEIWLKQGDWTAYTSQAAAQGFVTIHYNRPDGNYEGWGVHLWGDGLAPGVGTGWATPRPIDGTDDFGVYWTVGIVDATKPVNFIIHNGEVKDPGPDQVMNPWETPAVWIKSADVMIYPQRCAADEEVILHYHRFDGDYGDYTSSDFNDFWGMHTWGAAWETSWAAPRRPVEIDTFGPKFQVPLTVTEAVNLNYILHRGDAKDPGPDQTLDSDTYGCEVWQLQGANPEKPYLLPIIRGAAGAGDLSKQRAHWINQSTIVWNIEAKAANNYALHYAPEGGMVLASNVISGGLSIRLFLEPAGLTDEQKAQWPHLANYTVFRLRSEDLALVPDILKGQMAVSESASGFVSNATGLQIPGVLDALYTYSGALGVTFNAGAPTVAVWAPTAKSVKLHVYDDATTDAGHQVFDMTAGAQGVWSAAGDASWNGKYYLFEVEVYVNSTGQVEHNMVTDPYSLALAMNSTRSLIVDLSDPALAPAGWGTVAKPPLSAPEDIKLYELHVRDFSINDTTVPEAERGTYKAFTHTDSDGMTHLKSLQEDGLTHVHLLPVFDIATINENKAERVEPIVPNAAPDSDQQQAAVMATADQDGFNWGYDPYHYTAPEGSYSTNPEGVTRIIEFRQMVQSLHESGLRVVMDVVYNHTNSSGQAEKSVLDKIVPGYYHRLDENGVVTTSTCCANTASEHAMFEKLMIDSLVTWTTQYGVDGYRFDLMGHHMKSNMINVRDTLQAIDPTIYVYGEGWDFGEVAGNARGVNATQLNMAGTGVGTFNDRLRDAVRGGGPFDSGDGLVMNQGFVNGLWYDPNALNDASDDEKAELLLSADQIRVGLAGNLADYQFVDRNGNLVTGAQVDYNGSPAGYNQDPQEHIVYVEAHDNQTLFDINAYKMPLTTAMADRVRAQNLGLDFTLLAQGVPFLHAGEEILRSKSMDRNSYNSGDWFNRLDWTLQTNNFGVGLPPAGDNQGDWPIIGPRLANGSLKPGQADMQANFVHAQELLQIRNSSPLFRLQTEADVMGRLQFHNTGAAQIPGLIVMSLSDEAAALPDLDAVSEQIVVLFNATDVTQTFTLSDVVGQSFQLHTIQANSADAVVRGSTYDEATGAFTAPPRTTAVFVQSVELTGLEISPGVLTPVFDGAVFSYTAQLPALAQSLTLTPAAQSGIVMVNGVTVTSGSSIAVPLAANQHPTVTVELQNEAGARLAVYTIWVNRAPFTPYSAWATPFNTPLAVDLLRGAGDLDGDPVTVAQVATMTETHGTVSEIVAGRNVTYTPDSGFSGLAFFGFNAVDGQGGSSSGFAFVLVGNDPASGEGNPQLTEHDPSQVVVSILQAAGTATVTLSIPTGAYSGVLALQDVFYLVYTQILSPTAETQTPPSGLKFAGQQFRLEGYLNNNWLPGVQFAEPITLTISYDPALDIGGVVSDTLSLWYWDSAASQWSQNGITLISRDTVNHNVTFRIAHLSLFALFGAAAPTALDEELEPATLPSLYLPFVNN